VTRSHLTRVVVIWFVISLIADLVVLLAIGSNMPPGRATTQASDQTTTNLILTCTMIPIMVAVWTYFGYAFWAFRARSDGDGDGYGEPIWGHRQTELGWVGVTLTIVILLAIYGSYALYSTTTSAEGAGAGGGQGPTPITSPSGHPLQVQVISQQWQFTYRYPQYGGVETFVLELPADRTTELHVTSLDVVHSFWAYQLGVKADAVPGADNIAYVTPKHPLRFNIRCAELCGLWHGEMHAIGHVVTQSQFASWIAQQQSANRYSTHYLPHYGPAYYPVPYGRAG
jgi:cytochrome c oxidase subunit II